MKTVLTQRQKDAIRIEQDVQSFLNKGGTINKQPIVVRRKLPRVSQREWINGVGTPNTKTF